MSGHSKWATIKRQKGATDAKRGQLFTKLAREITVVAREGGDPNANSRLRLAIQRARDHNLPLDNIDRAIKRGQGAADAGSLAEISYEGYGPGGTAILVDVYTDNRNRTLSEVRNVFSRGGGSLGEAGCVAWNFEPRGVILAEAGADAEALALYAIDAGAEDVKIDDGSIEVQTQPQGLEAVRQSLERRGIPIASAEISKVPRTLIDLGEKEALQALKLLERLEELDDVQHVYTNANFPDHVLEKIRAEAAR